MKFKVFAFFLGMMISFCSVAGNPQVEMKTNMGSFTLLLYSDKAPGTVENFLRYVNGGFYKGTIFHRVIDNFMIQGGGFDGKLQEKETFAPIRNEANNGLKNDVFTIAMARTMNPHSAAAQFFINVKDNDYLNYSAPTQSGWGYTVFGKVVKGQEVVKKIAQVRTGPRGPLPSDVPLENVIIEDVKVLP